MSSYQDIAEKFLDACETGKGWEACRTYCSPEATFSTQAESLSGVDTLHRYTGFMKGLFTPVPDGRYEVKAIGENQDQNLVLAYLVFSGTHTGEGGPLPPTGKKVESDYVYVMEFQDGCIQHMTKIWNDVFAMKQLGWA
jgi:predicted ester cyclase